VLVMWCDVEQCNITCSEDSWDPDLNMECDALESVQVDTTTTCMR